jgi:hypothetical protein
MSLCPNVPLSTLFSNSLIVRRSLDVSGQLRALVCIVLGFRAALSGGAFYCYVWTAYCWKMVTMIMTHGGCGGGDTSSTKIIL